MSGQFELRNDVSLLGSSESAGYEKRQCSQASSKMASRLSGVVVIHAAAFLVAVFSLGSGAGVGASPKANSLHQQVRVSPKPVQAVVVESRGRVLMAQAMPIVRATDPANGGELDAEFLSSATENATAASAMSTPASEAIVTTSVLPEN